MKLKCKKLFTCLLAFLVFATCLAVAAPVQADSSTTSYHQSAVKLKARAAIAIDPRSGQILYAKNAGKALPIASMTKLVTVYLTLKAIKNKKLSWRSKIKPTKTIVKVANNNEYSNVSLAKTHFYTIKQLYQATLIESANGAAMCLAQAVAGSQIAFVHRMRQQVKKWGINDAKIYTVCGLPNGNVGRAADPNVSKKAENKMSARDMAIVGQKLLTTFPQILKTTRLAHLDFRDQNKTTVMTNFDWMLKGLSQYDPAFPIDGLKTGTTAAAGACFIASCNKNHHRLLTVVMGARHRNSNDPSRFVQTKKLLNYLYQHYLPVVLAKKTVLDDASVIKVTDGDKRTTNIGLKEKTLIWDPIDGKKVTAKLTRKEASAPISKGQVVSHYRFSSGAKQLITLTGDHQLQAAAQALQNNQQVNIFVRFWRWLIGER